MIISALGLVDPKDPKFNGDPAAAQAEARADAKRQLIEKAAALYVNTGSLDKNYGVIEQKLLPALAHLQATLETKAREFEPVIKTGRTHLMDATPIRLGQEFSGYASQIEHSIERVRATLPDLRELAIGGTAVGTGLNTHPDFGRLMAAELSKLAGTSFVEARNHFEAQGAQDGAAWASVKGTPRVSGSTR